MTVEQINFIKVVIVLVLAVVFLVAAIVASKNNKK